MSQRTIRILLGLAIMRFVIPIVALAFIPVLWPERIELLTLVRPGKESLLAGGFYIRRGDTNIVGMLAAYTPLMIVSVWGFFALGRGYGPTLRAGDGPEWLNKALPSDKLMAMERVLEKRGPIIAFIGRVAAMPPTILAAAAGTSKVNATRYLISDFIGSLVAFAMTVGLGWALGETYERAGIWLTIGSLVLIFVTFQLFSRWVQRELERDGGSAPADRDGEAELDGDEARS